MEPTLENINGVATRILNQRCRFFSTCDRPIRHDDFGPFSSKGESSGPPDAGTGPGHEGHLSFKCAWH